MINSRFSKNKKLKVLQWNSRSLNKQKLDELLEYSKINNINVISVCETWWEDKLRPTPSLKDWRVFSHNQNATSIKKCKGGVAIFIHKTVYATKLELEVGSEDIVGTHIYTSSHESIYLFSCYSAPLRTSVVKRLHSILSSFTKKNLIITGDFNARSPVWCVNSRQTCRNGNLLTNLCDDYNLVCINNGEPTRFPKNQFFKPRSIDLIFCSKSLSNKSVFKIDSDLSSDHRPVIIYFNSFNLKSMELKEFWNFKKANVDEFQKNCIKFFNMFLESNKYSTLDSLVEKFGSLLLSAAKSSVPVVKETQYHPNSWWSKEIKKLVKKRKRQRKKWQRTRTPRDYKTYFNTVKVLRTKILESKRNSYFSFCKSLKMETGALQWKKLRWLTKSRDYKIPTLEYQDVKITKNIEKASILMMQYRKTSREDNTRFDRNHKIRVERKVNREYRSHFYNESVNKQKVIRNEYSFDKEFTLEEIQLATNKLKVNAAGGDKINNWFLKKLPLDVLKILLFIFNKSYREGKFPKMWKNADIIPIFKSGKDPTKPKNYRPISLLSCLGKLMERLVYNRLYWISEKCNFLSDEQCGFRQRKSTIEPLIRLTQDIHRGFSTKSSTYAVFLDISKAYDTVWKDGLRFKLFTKGVRGRLLFWLSDFLEHRKGRVKLDDCVSNFMNLECGVPQGSVLSTLLFILYVDGVRSVIKHCEISIFADDIALWIVENDYNKAIKLLNEDLERIYIWCQKWRFDLSIEKCISTVFTKSCKTRENFIRTRPIKVNGIRLEVDLNPRFLGLWFDSRLTWNYHFSKIKETVERKLGMLKRVAQPNRGGTRSALLVLYKSFILPSIDYGSAIYGSGSKTSLKKLDILQNKCLRFVTRALPWTNKTVLEAETGVMPLEERRNLKVFKVMHKVLKQKDTSPLQILYRMWYHTRHITEYRGKFCKSLFSRFLNLCESSGVDLKDLDYTDLFSEEPPWEKDFKKNRLFTEHDIDILKRFQEFINNKINTDFIHNEHLQFYRKFKENINTKLFNFEHTNVKSKIIFRLRSKCCKLRAHSHLSEDILCRFCNTSLETIDHIFLRCGKLDFPRDLLREKLGEIISPSAQFTLKNILGNYNFSIEKQKQILDEVVEFLRLIKVEV